MAEDEAEIEDQNEEDEEDFIGRRIIKEHKDGLKRKKCNSRIEQLATPNRRYFLALWEQHAYHFEKQRAEALKAKLQELYAMTPEETERYFAKLREEAMRQAWRKNMRDKMKKLVAKRKKLQNQRKAYTLFRKLLKNAMIHAFNHEVPMLVSLRLRLLSDVILEQLCDLRNLDVPDRLTSDKLGKFLISVADWFAVGVENMYFVVQLKKNEELEEIENTIRIEEEEKKNKKRLTDKGETNDQSEFKPVIASTPRQSVDLEVN